VVTGATAVKNGVIARASAVGNGALAGAYAVGRMGAAALDGLAFWRWKKNKEVKQGEEQD
jgi:hypothetical protein